MVKSKKPNLENKWIKISLGVVIILVVWFYFFQDSDEGFNFDEEKYIRNSLSEKGYNVIDAGLNGTTISVELSCPSAFVTLCDPSLSDDSTWLSNLNMASSEFNWLLRISLIMNTLSSAYEVEPYEYDILKMSKKELESLGIDYDEIQDMSDEELKEVVDILGSRASIYLVKIHTPYEVCSYKLTRDTSIAFDKAYELALPVEVTNSLYYNMISEIKNYETCY